MLARLALLFVLVPLAELAILVWLGDRVGVLPTIALVIGTGALGAALARHQGLATWGRFRRALAEGRPPHRELVEGLLVLVAGALLLTPGLLTDSAGFLLLVPAVRRWAATGLTSRLRARLVVGRTGGGRRGSPAGTADGGGPAVDAAYRVLDEEERE